MASTISENEVVVSLVECQAQLIGEQEVRLVPAGSLGTVVLVHLKGSEAVAYEVEFSVGHGGWALATVLIDQVDRNSDESVYHAVVWQNEPQAIGMRVAALAPSLLEARQKLEAKYGAGTVFDLRNDRSANQTR